MIAASDCAKGFAGQKVGPQISLALPNEGERGAAHAQASKSKESLEGVAKNS